MSRDPLRILTSLCLTVGVATIASAQTLENFCPLGTPFWRTFQGEYLLRRDLPVLSATLLALGIGAAIYFAIRGHKRIAVRCGIAGLGLAAIVIAVRLTIPLWPPSVC